MPTSSWVHPSTDLVKQKIQDMLRRCAKKGYSTTDLLSRLSQQQSSDKWDILAQVEDDNTIFRGVILELIKHPCATIIQFAGNTLATTDMWEWQRSPSAHLTDEAKAALRARFPTDREGSAEETALHDFLAGGLVPLNDAQKKAKLGRMRESIRLMVHGHGGLSVRAGGTIIGGHTPQQLLAKIGLIAEHMPMADISHFYMALRGCSMVMPMEQVSDGTSFIGTFVDCMSARYPQINVVEASGYRFDTCDSSDPTDLSLRRLVANGADPFSAEDLNQLGWGAKGRAMLENGRLISSGRKDRLTRFERALIDIGTSRAMPDGVIELVGAMLQALSASTVIPFDDKNASRWEALRCLSQCIDNPAYPDPWTSSRDVKILGGRNDTITFFFENNAIDVLGLRRQLVSFKYKMLHSYAGLPHGQSASGVGRLTQETFDAEKTYIQSYQAAIRGYEELYLPNDWLSAHAPAFSVQSKLAEGHPELPFRATGLSSEEYDALQLALKKPLRRRVAKLQTRDGLGEGTFEVTKVTAGTKEKSYPTRQKINELAEPMSDAALSKALVFTVEFTELPDAWGRTSEPTIWRTTLRRSEAMHAIRAIEATINSAGDRFKSTIHRINRQVARGVDSAIQKPSHPSDPYGYSLSVSAKDKPLATKQTQAPACIVL